jgi:Pentapeptide repeats (8 copies)
MDLQAAIRTVLEAETDDFVELLQLSGLSPQEDLQGLDLRGVDLRGKRLQKWNLASCNLEGADLRDTDLRESNLVATNLAGADLRRALYHDSIRSVAILAGAILDDNAIDPLEYMIKEELQRAVGDDARTSLVLGRVQEIAQKFFSDNYGSRFELWRSVATTITSDPSQTAAIVDLIDKMPFAALYVEKIDNLAFSMWNAHGQSEGATPLEFYIAAERHVSLLLAGAIKSGDIKLGKSAKSGGDKVVEVFQEFSAEKYLAFIRREAYFEWKNRGAALWDSLRDWLKAEIDVLEKLFQGDVIPLLAAS